MIKKRLLQRRPGSILATMLLGASLLSGMEAPAQVSSPTKSSLASDEHARFAGTYRSATTTAEETARTAAIEKAVGGMSVFIRSMARSRISATTQILASYSISFEPGKIIVRPQGRPEMISGDQGQPVEYAYNGNRSKLTQKLADDHIVQAFVSEDGARQNEFTLSQDGQTLTLKVMVTSPKLSAPVVYSLSYKKTN